MTIINRHSDLGGAVYPFLHHDDTHQRWAMSTWDVDGLPLRFRQADPTIRWVKEDQVNDLYVEDTSTQDFLAKSGLRFSLEKGGYVLSKRISRLMRPYFISGFFARQEIRVTYLDLDERGRKIWDGAGQISRALLLRLIDQLPAGISPAKRQSLTRELRHGQRFEFTLMGPNGQDKGHASVVDDLDADLVLPRDTKPQVQFGQGDTLWIGLYPVHARDDMRLDVQSLLNLYPFFQPAQLLQWLQQEGDLFLESIQSGEMTAVLGRIGRLAGEEALDKLLGWHLREYLLSQGDPMWFGSIVKALVNQHLKRIEHTTRHKLRLPLPGARYYVMTDTVGQRHVKRGEITLDPDSATAWVNSDDWVDYQADVLGGADQDDALWLHPFTDYDGQQRILAWRSPNQCGEYILLTPSADSHIPTWATTGDAIRFPPGDSRQLPPRIDRTDPAYQNLVDTETVRDLGAGQTYSVQAMNATIARAAANKGTLGQYCNTLMLAKALYNRLPARPAAPLEAVIDATVKTGADTSRVRSWCYGASRAILQQKKPVPVILQDRLSLDRRSAAVLPPPISSTGHWLDELVRGIDAHIERITTARDQLMRETMPPAEIFAAAFAEKSLTAGARFNQFYTRQLPWRRPTPSSLETARQASETYLQQSADKHRVLRGAIAHYYLNPDHHGRDEAVWQLGAQTETGRRPGIAQDTIRALRQIGVLEEIALTDRGTIDIYPGAKILSLPSSPIVISGVWFNWLRCQDPSTPERMGQVPKRVAEAAKARVSRYAQTLWRGLKLTIERRGERKVAITPHGNLFGYIHRSQDDVVSDTLEIAFGLAKDGNLICLPR
jgi:hypothetical protein